MAFELILLGALIFIFIVSFCGLLQKIKQTYDRERLLAERIAVQQARQRNRARSDSFTEVFANPVFVPDSNGAVFPAPPPPYTQYYGDSPPKYEEVIKVHSPMNNGNAIRQNVDGGGSMTDNHHRLSTDSAPPPYTINVVTIIAEPGNRQ